MATAPRVFWDADADLGQLEGERVAVLGYGNQGRSQAQNLRDSGVSLVVGVPRDESREAALSDGFAVAEVEVAAAGASICLVLLPDEALPDLFATKLRAALRAGQLLIFASGYAVAFERIALPGGVDLALVAPRMFGPGVRERFLSGEGFPAFVGVERDTSGRAWPLALAVAKAIGATRGGCLELSFAQEAALDLFNEQAFGPAFGVVLTNACQTLVDAGIPPEAAMLEILHSGEFAYALERMRREGVIEQMEHHSRTSQYGAMTRAIRFLDLDLRPRMDAVLEDIRSGRFAEEWSREERAGALNFEKLRAARAHHPLVEWDRRTRKLFDR
jgi:ketol-acid reductoisomerase